MSARLASPGVRVMALAYHDVRPLGERGASGFEGVGAERFKITPERFAGHVEVIARSGEPRLVGDAVAEGVLLTFDDGGRSAVSVVAPALERRGWRAHFFVVTSRLGSAGFVDRAGVLDLHARGHLVGSHSHTHPVMTRLTDSEIGNEWAVSKAILEDLLGASVTAASVPTGFYERRVARLAAEAGYTHVFTSEPWLEPRGGGLVWGRFAITAGTSSADVAGLCRFSRSAVWRYRGGWYGRKAARRVLGPAYRPLRDRFLARRR